jgi:hypothetical protein
VEKIQGSPERTQTLLDTLYAKGVEGDVKSAQLWLAATNRLQPATVKVESSRSQAADLSDEELDRLIGLMATREVDARQRLKVV